MISPTLLYEAEEVVTNWCNQYGGTTCKGGSSGFSAQKKKDKEKDNVDKPPEPFSTKKKKKINEINIVDKDSEQ